MRITFISLIILLQVTCSAQDKVENPVTIRYQVDKLNSNEFKISFIMNIKEPYKIISPNSSDKFWIKMEVTFNDTTLFSLTDKWSEVPGGSIEFDSLIDEPVRVHRTNVTYSMVLKLGTTRNFEVVGLIKYQPSMTINRVGLNGHSIFCNNSFKLIRKNGGIEIFAL